MMEYEQQELHLTLEDSISVLRNMKRRTREYGEIYGYMGEEYCRRLAEVERRAIDIVIFALEMGNEMVDLPPKEPPAMPITVPLVTSLDEASEVMTPKEIHARCRAEKPDWKIGESTIRTWAKTGQLPCMRSGSRILISWAAFCSFVTSGTAQVGSPTVPKAASANGSTGTNGAGAAKAKRDPEEKRPEMALAPQQAVTIGPDYQPSPEILEALKCLRERTMPSKQKT